MTRRHLLIAGVLVLAAAAFLHRPTALVRVLIPPGLRKEETAAILAKDLKWSPAQEAAFMAASSSDASSGPDYSEGVYFPDTYLIPADESPADVATRLIGNFNTNFAPYQHQYHKKRNW